MSSRHVDTTWTVKLSTNSNSQGRESVKERKELFIITLFTKSLIFYAVSKVEIIWIGFPEYFIVIFSMKL